LSGPVLKEISIGFVSEGIFKGSESDWMIGDLREMGSFEECNFGCKGTTAREKTQRVFAAQSEIITAANVIKISFDVSR
jgi:hypothetical protein